MNTIEVAFIKAGEHICTSIPVKIPNELATQDSAEPPPGHGMFRILTAKDGDRRIVWNRLVLAEIRAAKEMFLELIDKGLVPYKVGTGGRPTSEIMAEFDPSAEEIMFLPIAAVVGG